jgi:protein-disulfide isomerase
MSLDDFVLWWTAQVAEALNLDQATLESLYGDDDVYNTNQSVREFWKFGTSNGVSGTPSSFVNGVMLNSVPFSVEGWLDLLNTVYNSQYHPAATTRLSPIQN